VRDDGALFSDGQVPNAQPFSQLGLEVKVPMRPASSSCWSGAGRKRYLAGDRPRPDAVFDQVVAVVDWFIDFNRSLAPQDVMCELVEKLSVKYQTERAELEADDPNRLLVKCLRVLVAEQTKVPNAPVVFETEELAKRINKVAAANGDVGTNPKRVGWQLRKLRIKKASHTGKKRWQTTLADVEALAKAYGVSVGGKAGKP
jgi:hypothetical protein